MRIIFCGGGTAGHVSPAIAIAEYLLTQDKNADILFVGREGGEENRIIEKSGFNLQTVNIRGFIRKFTVENFKNLYIALKALNTAKNIIKNYSPDIVVGTGGYVCWPVIRAAQKLGIPTVIHESNACPGLVTKLLSPRCDRVLLNLNGSEKEFKNKDNIRIVGNPVRDEFLTLNKKEARKNLGINSNDFLISSFGGSGGSQKINESIIAFMKSHSTKSKNIHHIHSSGNKYYSEMKQKHPELTKGTNGCIIKPYIDNMPTVMAASDVIISRCGAMTIAEMSAVGACTILIPSPNVTNNHQYKNAKLIEEMGGCILLEEANLCERTLLDTVRRLESDKDLRNSLSNGIRKFYFPDSKKIIYEEIKRLAE